MPNLRSLKSWTFNVFNSLLPVEQPFKISFSGGKDSHALLGIYLEWQRLTGKSLNATVVFSDTYLETPSLYDLVGAIEDICNERGLPFTRVQPSPQKNYWMIQFGLGYPVPNFSNRWCTKYLKIEPINQIKGISMSGSHEGESNERDNRLKSCGSSECGIDLMKGAVEPIAKWPTCAVWDYLLMYGDKYLYKGVYQALADTYASQTDEEIKGGGSLRMGCFHCPVISKQTLSQNVAVGVLPLVSMEVRSILESLRVSPRLKSPRTLKNGALWVDARIKHWNDLRPLFPELLDRGWIDESTIRMVDSLLERRSYPPTYSSAWIKDQESLILDSLNDAREGLASSGEKQWD